MRDHQGRQKKRHQGFTPAKLIARRGQCRGDCNHNRDRGRDQAQSQAKDKGIYKAWIVQDRFEPAQRQAVHWQRDEAIARKRHGANHHNGRQNKHDKNRMKNQPNGAVA